MAPARKKPVFGSISLVLMLALIVGAVLVTVYKPPIEPIHDGESLAVAIGAIANIIATLVVIASVSLAATLAAAISFLRREATWTAAVGISLSLSSLAIVIYAITQL